jgi:hypothetical protein
MSRFFRRLHGRQEPPGLELEILKRMPKALAAGTLVPLALSVLVRILPAAEPGLAASKRILSTDIFVFATLLTFWTAVLTVSIGCVVVYIMKGPAYVADAYPLEDASRPAGPDQR